MYQGGEDILDDGTFFTERKITHVVGICHRSIGRHVFHQADLTPERVIHINEMDSTSADLSKYFERTTTFIHEARLSGGNVYVHCSAGISRSTTITLAYMMTLYDQPYHQLIPRVAKMRSCVGPNQAFVQQLKSWETDPKRTVLREKLLKDKDVEKILALDTDMFLALPTHKEAEEDWDL
mmetsp:Transcript_5434/g.7002  ORF Transcript_5434/g.7002 Transcript_5434/m.7002 type:complete len:180 (-) Transcript_5434:60-599(-)